MYDLMLYSLKTGACLAVFYLFYKLLLSRETFHRFNRVVLLAMLVLSFVLPCCVVTLYRDLPAPEPFVLPVVTQPALPVEAVAAAKPFPWRELLAMLFAAGVVAMLLWVVVSLVRVWSIVHGGRSERLPGGMVLVRRPEKGSPFSWGRYIVVSEQDDDALLRDVLLHEEAHLRLHHSVDLLVADLAGCLQWFNPAMWLLRRELRAIHEYEADEAVLRSGVDAREYQMLLIRKAAGRRWCSVANSFNHSKLKNRITMMLRKKSSRWNYARALVFLPLVGLALGAFAETVYRVPVDKGTQNSGTFLSSAVGNGTSVAALVDSALRDASAEAGQSASEGLAGSAQAALKQPAVRYFINGREVTVSALDTLKVERIASVDVEKSDDPASGIVRITLRGNSSEGTTDQYIYILDGQRKSYAELDIDPSEIASVKVIKEPSVIEQFDRPEAKGVVYILTNDFARQLEGSLRAGAEGLEAGRAGLEAARKHLSGDEWKKVQQQLREASEQLEQAQRELDGQQTEASLRQQIATERRERRRYEGLVARGAANTKQLDDIDARIAVLEKQLAAQNETLEKGNRSVSGEIEAIEAQLAQTDDMLARCVVTAPTAGTVLAKYAERGEMAQQGRALFKMGALDRLYLRAYMTAPQVTGLKVGSRVTVLADMGEEGTRRYEGTVAWISDKAEFTPKTIQTRDERANLVYAVKVAVKNDGFIKIGMYGDVLL